MLSACLHLPITTLSLRDACRYWFKIDSLWYSEDLAAVPDHDPQRVCVLHGPVSVRHNKTTDQSAKDILDEIYNGWSKVLLGDTLVDSLPTVDYLRPETTPAASAAPTATNKGGSAGSASGSAPTTPGRRSSTATHQQSPARSQQPWSVEQGAGADSATKVVVVAEIPGDSGSKLHDANTAGWLELLGDSSRAG